MANVARTNREGYSNLHALIADAIYLAVKVFMNAHRRLKLLAVLATLGPGVAPLCAQKPGSAVFRGTVTGNHGQMIVDGAEITFEEAKLSVRTTADGKFSVSGLAPGEYKVNVRHPGFGPITGKVNLAANDTVNWHFDMVLENVELSRVNVIATDDRVQLRDFTRRRETTNGKFLTEKEIGESGGRNLGNIIIGRIPGFSVVQHPNGSGTALTGRRTGVPDASGRNGCYSAIWVNGDLFYSSEKSAMPVPALEDFNLQEIAGAEFYRASEVPPELQFRSGNCGVVMLWMQIRSRRPPK